MTDHPLPEPTAALNPQDMCHGPSSCDADEQCPSSDLDCHQSSCCSPSVVVETPLRPGGDNCCQLDFSTNLEECCGEVDDTCGDCTPDGGCGTQQGQLAGCCPLSDADPSTAPEICCTGDIAIKEVPQNSNPSGPCCQASGSDGCPDSRSFRHPEVEEAFVPACSDSCCESNPTTQTQGTVDESSKQELVAGPAHSHHHAGGTHDCEEHMGGSVHSHTQVSGLRQRAARPKDRSSDAPHNHHNHSGPARFSGRFTPRSALHRVLGRLSKRHSCCIGHDEHHHSHPTHSHTKKTDGATTETASRQSKPAKFSPSLSVGTIAQEIELAERGAGSRRRKLLMSVEGMDCPSCAGRVTAALLTIPSVTKPKVNTFAGEATLMYEEGSAIPEDLAKRVGVLTGFRCQVVRDSGEADIQRSMTILVPIGLATWDNQELPRGVVVGSHKQIKAGHSLLEVEYDSLVIQPRDVVAAFLPWGGEYFPKDTTGKKDPIANDVSKLLRRTAISSVACIPILVFAWAPLPPHPVPYGACSLALATCIQVYVAAPIYSSALRSLFLQKTIDMDLLVVLSTTVAYVYSIVVFCLEVSGRPFGNDFFETSALLITLIMIGRLVSAYARRRATSALDTVDALQVHMVNLVSSTGAVVAIPAELVHVGDVLRVYPDSTVPTDGLVVRGASQTDESSLTGESVPVEKEQGSSLIAGTLNLSGVLDMSVNRVLTDNTIANISRLMRETQDSRLPIQDLADKVASYLAPTVLVLSLATFTIWILIGVLARGQSSSSAAVAALKYSIAVMVISCPCAIALCVPMVVVITVGVAAKNGVLFKSVQSVQFAKDTTTVLLDKTGTLTEGKLSVVEAHFYSEDAAALAWALTSTSNHPVAKAIASHLSQTKMPSSEQKLEAIRSVPGKGIEALVGGTSLQGGNPSWLEVQNHEAVQELQKQALTIFVMKRNSDLIAAFGLRDSLRAGAEELVGWFKQRGAEVYIISGDEPAVVAALALRLGIPTERAVGGCTPQSKADTVRKIQSEGQKKVMFVGDGTNDSLALMQADTGVSLSSGTDVAISAADVIIVNPTHLARSIQVIFDLSDSAYRRIIINFAWAFIYNLFAVLLAAGAFVKVTIKPEYAGLGEMVSVLPVLLIAWSIRWLAVTKSD